MDHAHVTSRENERTNERTNEQRGRDAARNAIFGVRDATRCVAAADSRCAPLLFFSLSLSLLLSPSLTHLSLFTADLMESC